MAQIIQATTHSDPRGSLTVIEKILPFEIKRVFYIYNVTAPRGGHRHKRNQTALFCVKGSCKIEVDNGEKKEIYVLDSPEKILLLGPDEYRTMFDFSSDAVLMALVSEYYDPDDYINEPLKK